MKKNYLWGICAVMALSSCSQDDVVSVPQTSINYSVVTNKASRAQDVFCNNNLPDHFYVSAELTQGTTNPVTYFTEDLVTVNSANSCTQENLRYWPEEGTLDFYAYANGDKVNGTPTAVNFSLAEKEITGYEVGTTVAEQKDLIYAVEKGKGKPAADASTKDVSLNFRHALSQIVFQAQNLNPNIYVEISGVEIHNVANKGDFTFPAASTTTNITDHDQNGTNQITPQGTWTLGTTTADYIVDFEAVPVPYVNDNTKVNLTNNQIFGSTDDNDANEGTDFSKAMLLLPQGTIENPVDAFDKNSINNWSVAGVRATESGAFFFVKCKIWNVADSSVGKQDTDVLVYSKEGEAKEILMPVEIVWNQGYKYVYTFIFKKQGNGGTDPDDGEDVLVPITYTITVDDFTNETEEEVEMDTTPDSNN